MRRPGILAIRPRRGPSSRLALIASGIAALAGGGLLFAPEVGALATRAVAWLSASPLPAVPSAVVIPVTVATARVDDVPIYLSGIGTVQAYNTVSVKTRVDGEIVQVLFREGQEVKAGDPLVIIDPRPFEAQLQQAEAQLAADQAQLKSATLDLGRYESLVIRDFATRQQVDQQRALVDQTRAQTRSDEAQIRYARTQLDYTRVLAPISGRVGVRLVDGGNIVHAADNTSLVVITQLQPISGIFTLPALAVAQSRITLGTANLPVIALAQDDKTELDRGTIDLVDNQVDPSTGTIKLKASFPNTALKLWPGNFITGRLIVDTKRAAVTVPSSAVRHGPRGDFVWVVRSDKRAEFRSVTLGQAFGGRTLIDSGLAHGEEVVVDGYYRLENGTQVQTSPAVQQPAGPG
jgi:multidrug efflux system membrane fusion protein